MKIILQFSLIVTKNLTKSLQIVLLIVFQEKTNTQKHHRTFHSPEIHFSIKVHGKQDWGMQLNMKWHSVLWMMESSKSGGDS